MTQKENLEKLAQSVAPEELRSVSKLLYFAMQLEGALGDKTYRQMSAEQRQLQQRLAAAAAALLPPAGLQQLHALMHLIEGHYKVLHPNALKQYLRQLPPVTPVPEGPADVVIREDLPRTLDELAVRGGAGDGGVDDSLVRDDVHDGEGGGERKDDVRGFADGGPSPSPDPD